MGSELWARPVQLGVCFARSRGGHCRREAGEVQQYGEIRSWSGAAAVWTEKSRRHHRNFLGAYHRGPSSPPLSHPWQTWCRGTVRAAARPSPGPAAIRHHGCKTHRSGVAGAGGSCPDVVGNLDLQRCLAALKCSQKRVINIFRPRTRDPRHREVVGLVASRH